MRIMIVALVASLLSACVTYKPGPLTTTMSSASSGKIWFASSSPYDFKEVLDGTSPRQVIDGDLSMPTGSQGRKIPAMVIMHGSGGVHDYREGRYAAALNEIGIATFVVDSFSPRGIVTTIDEQIGVTEQMMVADAYAALKVLRSHPGIDPDRIGVMGTSKGGVVALYTAFEGVRNWFIKDDAKFAAHVPIYPFCGIDIENKAMTSAPVLMQLGEVDDYTPKAICTDFVARLGADVAKHFQTIIYKDAHHAWDGINPPKLNMRGINPSDCKMLVQNNGITIIPGTDHDVTSKWNRGSALRVCAKRGVTYGVNQAAKKKSLEDLKSFLREEL